MAVNVKQHSLEVTLQDACLEIGCGTQRIGSHLGAAILRHHRTVFIIQVGQAEGLGWHIVKEALLGLKVVLEGLMIIQMVAGKIGKDSPGKAQSADALLRHAMRTDLHKGIFAARIGHAA